VISATDWSPDDKKLRNFGFIGVFVFGLLGAWARLRGHVLFWDLSPEAARTVAWSLWGLAGACGAAAVAAPRFLLPLYTGLMLVALPIGYVVSHVAFASIYYLVLTPIGVCMRLAGRDPLARPIDKQCASYWFQRPPAPPAERFFRQY
jgi:hypothetical protein